jgi:hypothetical protein
MGIILLVLLLALILGGLGFAIHILWWIALVVLVIWLIGVQALAQPGDGGDIDLTCHNDNGASWFAADPDGQARVHDRSPPGVRTAARCRSACMPDGRLPPSSFQRLAGTLMAQIGSASASGRRVPWSTRRESFSRIEQESRI